MKKFRRTYKYFVPISYVKDGNVGLSQYFITRDTKLNTNDAFFALQEDIKKNGGYDDVVILNVVKTK